MISSDGSDSNFMVDYSSSQTFFAILAFTCNLDIDHAIDDIDHDKDDIDDNKD